MARYRPVRDLLLLWLAWIVVMFGFQKLVVARFAPQRPDNVLFWTSAETRWNGQADKPYLLEPTFNEHVSWDSEFYISVATKGYDDPDLRSIALGGPRGRTVVPSQDVSSAPSGPPPSDDGPPSPGNSSNSSAVATSVLLGSPPGVNGLVSLNYAFFPLYGYAARALSIPLGILGLNAVGTATIAGLLLALLGTLAAMAALYDLVQDQLGGDGGFRAAFYLLIFPTGFFLAQVYTEGLFVGLAFGSLALMRRRHLLAASILAALATWTRPVGVALVLPLALAGTPALNRRCSVRRLGDWKKEQESIPSPRACDATQVSPNPAGEDANPGPRWLVRTKVCLALLLPVAAFLAWRFSRFGAGFYLVEDYFFGRSLLAVGPSLASWSDALHRIGGGNTQATVYYVIEIFTVLLAFAACLATWRRYPGLALFGLVALAVAVFSAAPQSMARYMLVVPSIYILLAQLGRARAFDRGWTIASTLLMGLEATLFSFDMWVG